MHEKKIVRNNCISNIGVFIIHHARHALYTSHPASTQFVFRIRLFKQFRNILSKYDNRINVLYETDSDGIRYHCRMSIIIFDVIQWLAQSCSYQHLPSLSDASVAGTIPYMVIALKKLKQTVALYYRGNASKTAPYKGAGHTSASYLASVSWLEIAFLCSTRSSSDGKILPSLAIRLFYLVLYWTCFKFCCE